jgi:hypothetical protein
MAREVGIESVQPLWSANEIRPHLTRIFKLSRDLQCEDKFWDVIACT